LAQGALVGRVVHATDLSAIAGATVRVVSRDLRATSGSDGRFRITLPAGRYVVVVTSVGIQPDSAEIMIYSDSVTTHEFRMNLLATRLDTVDVKAKAQSHALQLAGFYDRKSQGVGSFIGPDEIERGRGLSAGAVVAKTSRVSVRYGGPHAWLATNRNAADQGCALCRARIQDLLDIADIYGQNAHQPQPLFDVNSLDLSQIEGIEIYSSASQVPIRFNATSSGCGVALIWMKHQ
jgi:hypothetical protein